VKATKDSLSDLHRTESTTSEPTAKRTRKVLNKKEKEHLVTVLKSIDVDVLMHAERMKIDELDFPCDMKDFIEGLF